MNSIIRLVVLVAGLVLLLNSTPSWGQPVCVSPGCNPVVSDANRNTAGGTNALGQVDETLSGGFENTAFGNFALYSNTTGDNNTAHGYQALYSNTGGGSNTASGHQALYSNTIGGNNTASGYKALYSNAVGFNNIATGTFALYSNTSGSDNTADGFLALELNTTGAANTASGSHALNSNTTGNSNTANGTEALYYNVTGSFNTASGLNALYGNLTGNDNTASGAEALFNTGSGFGNTAVGRSALFNAYGNKNIAIGYKAGFALATGNNNIFIFIGTQGVGDESQTIRIGAAQTRAFIAGIGTTHITGNAATVEINTITGQLGIVTSSARYKEDIAPMGTRSEKVLDLRPVTFAYKDDAQAITHYGLIAEEVATVYPELVTRTASGEVQTVKYQELIPMLLNELQRQRHEFQQALQSQQQELAELRALVGQGRGKVVLGGKVD